MVVVTGLLPHNNGVITIWWSTTTQLTIGWWPSSWKPHSCPLSGSPKIDIQESRLDAPSEGGAALGYCERRTQKGLPQEDDLPLTICNC